MPDFKLGKLPPRIDPRTLRLKNYLAPEALPPIPAQRAWDRGQQSWGVMVNDRLGCCTCSAMGHAVQVWSANNGSEITVTDADVLTAYEAVGHYNPADPNTDQGATELDALKYWYSTGVGGHRLGAFADVDPRNHDLIHAAIDLFGAVYIGVVLPVSAQSQARPDGLWDVVNPDGGQWGGHAVVVCDYDATSYTCITWGFLQRISVAFWNRYVDECHALIGPEWFGQNAQAPSGFDLAALTRDLAVVSGQPDPGPPPFQPDPAVLAGMDWLTADTAWLRNAYVTGDVKAAAQQLRTQGSYASSLGVFLASIAAGPAQVSPLPVPAPPTLPGGGQ